MIIAGVSEITQAVDDVNDIIKSDILAGCSVLHTVRVVSVTDIIQSKLKA